MARVGRRNASVENDESNLPVITPNAEVTSTESETADMSESTEFYADDITTDVEFDVANGITPEDVLAEEIAEDNGEVNMETGDDNVPVANEPEPKVELPLITPDEVKHESVKALLMATLAVKNDYESSNGILIAVTSGAEEKEKHFLSTYTPGTDEMLDTMLAKREEIENEIESLKLKLMTTQTAISANVKSKVLNEFDGVDPEKLRPEVTAKYEAFRKTRGTLGAIINAMALADPTLETDLSRYVGNVNSPAGTKKSTSAKSDSDESRAYLKINLVEVEVNGTFHTIEDTTPTGTKQSNFKSLKGWLDENYQSRTPLQSIREWYFKTNNAALDDVAATQVQTVGEMEVTDRKNTGENVTLRFRVTRKAD